MPAANRQSEMTKILKLRVINILSDELFCKAGLEHDFNCLIVKRIFDKEGGAVWHDSSRMRFSLGVMIFHTSNGRGLCV